MRVVQINTVCNGSTGKICLGIRESLNAAGIENAILYSVQTDSCPEAIACAPSGRYVRFQALKSRFLGNYGFNSRRETGRILRELDRLQPDVVQLHNIHGHDCHLEMLFAYLREKKIKVFWTFHDCWAFTAYCPHYAMIGCDRWKTGCHACPQYRRFSWLFDRSAALYEKKKEAFSDVDLTIITPSQWLAEQVKQSFLKEYPVHVIHSGIDLSVFQPAPSSFRAEHGIRDDQFVLLGVAAGWDERKGLDVFCRLARELGGEKYKIVLVGTNDQVDKLLPENVVSIHRTENQSRLAEIYSAADLFVNPTREEVLGLVNLEALACGTPVVTFRSGGSPECIDGSCGAAVDCDDFAVLKREIEGICVGRPYSPEACLARARQFDMRERFGDYVALYQKKML